MLNEIKTNSVASYTNEPFLSYEENTYWTNSNNNSCNMMMAIIISENKLD